MAMEAHKIERLDSETRFILQQCGVEPAIQAKLADTGKGKLGSMTPDGRPICYRYNNRDERCRGPCPYVYLCWRCYGNHPVHACTAKSKKSPAADAEGARDQA